MAESIDVAIKNVRGGFYFEVFIDGMDDILQTFTKVSGSKSNSEGLEYMHGGDQFVQRAPGRPTFDNVTFERIYNGVDELYKWRRAIEDGIFDDDSRRDVTVYLKDSAGKDIRKMVLVKAWPISWNMPDLDANSSSPAIEIFELAATQVFEEKI